MKINIIKPWVIPLNLSGMHSFELKATINKRYEVFCVFLFDEKSANNTMELDFVNRVTRSVYHSPDYLIESSRQEGLKDYNL